MAEVVGLVASSLTLLEVADKVTRGLFQLKRLWDEVKDVPETIREILTRLDVLLPVVIEIDKDLQRGAAISGNSAAVLSLSYCQNAINELTSVIDDLSRNIESVKGFRRNAARVKVVLKKDALSKYERKLEWAIQLLLLAQQLHTIAILRLQPEAIVQCLVSSELSIRPEPDSEKHQEASSTLERTAIGKSSQQISAASHSRNWTKLPWRRPSLFGSFVYNSYSSDPDAPLNPLNYCARLQLPRWITNKAWDIMVAPGPNISLRTYSVVPHDSPIFECVKTGDVDKMLDLFRQGTASPLDVDQYGCGLFWTACLHGEFSMMVILRQLDIRCLERSRRCSWILGYLFCISKTDSVIEGCYHFLQENGAFDKENYDSDEQWGGALSNSRLLCTIFPDVLRLVLPHISPDHYTLSACKRLRSFNLYDSHPISLRLFLQPDGSIVANDVRELQQQAISLAVLVALVSTAQTRKQTPPTNDWRRFRRDTIAVTKSLSFQQGPLDSILERYSPLSHQPIGTAFSAIILGTMLSIYRWDGYEAKNDWIYQLNTALRDWLEDLSIAGVDLTEYGRIEKAVLSSPSVLEKSSSTLCGSAVQIPSDWFRFKAKRGDYYQIDHIKLENFTYGPKPTDWSYVWDYPTENFSGEFWDMIDNMALKVPGSWVEDSDSDESSSDDSDEWTI
ncbi:hypothetical protein BKA56DRAFT_588231 [Ilyonectria sp. MPI-CAGE-AT-0026]|nr:hypothetical protein BKA56DRAFT_588231 [Ilyonectria sp. MPI-CAGE-AT-0026]